MAYPTFPVPGIPARGNCCIRQLHKTLSGHRMAKWGRFYGCDSGRTQRGRMKIEAFLASAGPHCDQDPDPAGANTIPDGSRLRAEGPVIRRRGGFAQFAGAFRIIHPSGFISFRGRMVLIDRIGTHHRPFGTEECDARRHVEGWLEGRGGRRFPHHALWVLFVGRGVLPRSGGRANLAGFLNGSLMKCP